MKRLAFTLIEMLVVIAIIGIVAAMVVGMAARAKEMQRKAQVDASKHSLTLAIDTYQAKLNFFPPDNGNVANTNVGGYDYEGLSATNPLLYELTGATMTTNNSILLFNGTNVPVTIYSNNYNRLIVNNSNPDEPHSFLHPKPNIYTNYAINAPLGGLLVPVPRSLTLNLDGTMPNNFWHYDASSPNRHNLSSYDLWAEFVTGGKNGALIITTNGNW